MTLGGEPAEDRARRQHIDAPDDVPADNRRPVADKVLPQLPVAVEEVPEFQRKTLVNLRGVENHHRRLGNPGEDGRKGRAGHPQGREPEMAENQHPVEADVDHQRNRRHHHPDPGDLDTPHRRNQRLGDAEKDIGKTDRPEVVRPLFDNGRVAGKNRDDRPRENDADGCQHQPADDRKMQAD